MQFGNFLLRPHPGRGKIDVAGNERRPSMNAHDILVVDDDDNIAHILERWLTSEGHRVRIARDGREALAAIARQLPDLILTDIDMPHLGGYEVCTQIKRDPRTRLIPVIII